MAQTQHRRTREVQESVACLLKKTSTRKNTLSTNPRIRHCAVKHAAFTLAATFRNGRLTTWAPQEPALEDRFVGSGLQGTSYKLNRSEGELQHICVQQPRCFSCSLRAQDFAFPQLQLSSLTYLHTSMPLVATRSKHRVASMRWCLYRRPLLQIGPTITKSPTLC